MKLSRNSPVRGVSTARAGFEYKTLIKQLSRYTKQPTRITVNETCVEFKSLAVEGGQVLLGGAKRTEKESLFKFE